MSIIDSFGIDMFAQTLIRHFWNNCLAKIICWGDLSLSERKIRSLRKKKGDENYSFKSTLLIEHARCLIERTIDGEPRDPRTTTVLRIPAAPVLRDHYSTTTTSLPVWRR